MIYELRVYECPPGKLPYLNDRFANHTVKLFQKHGIKVIGFWTDDIGVNNRLTYMLGYDDLGDREKKWSAFQNDPEWQKVRSETEARNGPLVNRVLNTILRPTAYSPMQ